MANPTALSKGDIMDMKGLAIKCSQILDDNGKAITVAQQATIADAVVAHSLTDADASLGATTQAEVEGVLDALGVKINAILTALENAGMLADS